MLSVEKTCYIHLGIECVCILVSFVLGWLIHESLIAALVSVAWFMIWMCKCFVITTQYYEKYHTTDGNVQPKQSVFFMTFLMFGIITAFLMLMLITINVFVIEGCPSDLIWVFLSIPSTLIHILFLVYWSIFVAHIVVSIVCAIMILNRYIHLFIEYDIHYQRLHTDDPDDDTRVGFNQL
jgi:hypothetical protein